MDVRQIIAEKSKGVLRGLPGSVPVTLHLDTSSSCRRRRRPLECEALRLRACPTLLIWILAPTVPPLPAPDPSTRPLQPPPRHPRRPAQLEETTGHPLGEDESGRAETRVGSSGKPSIEIRTAGTEVYRPRCNIRLTGNCSTSDRLLGPLHCS